MNEKTTVKERLTPKQCLTVKPFLPGTCESPQSFAALTVLALKKEEDRIMKDICTVHLMILSHVLYQSVCIYTSGVKTSRT